MNLKRPIAKVYVVPAITYPVPARSTDKPMRESWEVAMRVSAATVQVLLSLGMDVEQELIEDAKVPRGRSGTPLSIFGGHEDTNPVSMDAIEIFKTVQILKRDFALKALPRHYDVASACFKPQERRHDLKARFIKK